MLQMEMTLERLGLYGVWVCSLLAAAFDHDDYSANALYHSVNKIFPKAQILLCTHTFSHHHNIFISTAYASAQYQVGQLQSACLATIITILLVYMKF